MNLLKEPVLFYSSLATTKNASHGCIEGGG